MFFEKLKSAANNSYFLILDFAQYREVGANYGIRDNLCLKVWNMLKNILTAFICKENLTEILGKLRK